MRRELILLLAIAAVALAVRVYPAYAAVFGGEEVNFVETDSWYHVRLVENQVRNFPWRVTLDPYAADGGLFVPIAPLYDTLTSTAVVLLQGTHASTPAIERIAAVIPPVLGTLAVVAAWALGRQAFNPGAGLLAAALLATMPGHFLDRTSLGFVDHHALEALLALSTLVFLARGSQPLKPRAALANQLLAGVSLGLYLLAWASGAFFVAILGLWLLIVALQAPPGGQLANVARLLGVTAVAALVLVIAFQTPSMYRYGTQVLALVGLALLGLVVHVAARRAGALPARGTVLAGLTCAVAAGAGVVWLLHPGLLQQVTGDVLRFTPSPSRMAVLEARPLFMYSGQWNWWQPWLTFRSGFYVGAIALAMFTVVVIRNRKPSDALVWTFAAATLAATLGQNRFGYYLVPAFAVVAGWLADEILAWGGWFRDRRPATGAPPLQREIALLAMIAAMFLPSVSTLIRPDVRASGVASFWLDAMFWLRQHTPEPFAAVGGDAYYYARYPSGAAVPDYTVMNWWDYGYLIAQRARRVPVANPTQERAPDAGRFFVETDEAQALAQLKEARARYVVADWELPFRNTPDGRVMGRFESVLDWAGRPHGDYFEVCFRRDGGAWTPVWVYHEPYYRSMTFRLVVAGGAAVTPRKPSVITTKDRVDSRGMPFREILGERSFESFDEAQQFAASAALGNAKVVGLDPRESPFPLEALTGVERVQDVSNAGNPPWIRIYRVR